jgi:glycosyltransferase involved in cell wall biosynthesis
VPLPLVSVVIPAYCCAQYIAQAVESVLGQSYGEHEILVINDGSPDTPLLERALEPFRDRIRYIRQAGSGPSAARNRGILQAHGQYVAFLDADDYWSPNHLSKQMELFRRDPSLELAYCDCILLKDEKTLDRAFGLQPQAAGVSFDALVVEDCAIGTSTTVVSRQAILRAGLFDESLMRCEDFEMWLRMSFGGSRMAYHPDADVFHRVSEHGLSADRLAMRRDRIRVYEKLIASLPLSRRQRATIEKLAADTRRDCDVYILKHLLENEDYQNALVVARRVKARSSSWKLTLAHLGLRLAPRLFGLLHRIRTRFVQREYPRRPLTGETLLSTQASLPMPADIRGQNTPQTATREEVEGIPGR